MEKDKDSYECFAQIQSSIYLHRQLLPEPHGRGHLEKDAKGKQTRQFRG